MYNKSKVAFEQSKKLIPGGVNSPVRAFKSVKCNPVFFDHGKGSKLYDVDGNEYIDCISSWGPLIFGHVDKITQEKLNEYIVKGTTYGAPTIIESKMAEKIIELVPSIEKVRMVNSGTEATMSAIRLARGYTSRSLILKFSGNYHGHGDSFLIKAGSGAMTLGLPDSPGVTKNTAKDTIIAEFNSIESVKQQFKKYPKQIAAVIIEPVAGNMGLVNSKKDFLVELREICNKNKTLLIFDEVMSGFRLASGGAQEIYKVLPDITTLGKIIGGGLPVGAYGGKSEIMDYLAPDGPVYQAGTLSGNPLAMSAGLSVLNRLDKNLYLKLENITSKIHRGFLNNIKETGTNAIINRAGSMMTLFFTNQQKIETYNDAVKCNLNQYAKYFKNMLDLGIYLPPSQYECMFISSSFTEYDIKKLIDCNKKSLELI
tara:strand:- start:9974 stop:11254 length:1281 start_codon:yes stop_codon:yes gene_type:complete